MISSSRHVMHKDLKNQYCVLYILSFVNQVTVNGNVWRRLKRVPNASEKSSLLRSDLELYDVIALQVKQHLIGSQRIRTGGVLISGRGENHLVVVVKFTRDGAAAVCYWHAAEEVDSGNGGLELTGRLVECSALVDSDSSGTDGVVILLQLHCFDAATERHDLLLWGIRTLAATVPCNVESKTIKSTDQLRGTPLEMSVDWWQHAGE